MRSACMTVDRRCAIRIVITSRAPATSRIVRLISSSVIESRDDVAAGVVEPRGEGGRLPEVAAQAQDADAGVGGLDLDQARQRPVARPVVHEDDLVGTAVSFQAGGDLAMEVADVLGLVVDGDHDGDVRPRCHREEVYAAPFWRR